MFTSLLPSQAFYLTSLTGLFFRADQLKNMYEVFSVVLNLDYGKGRQRNVESNLHPVVLKLFNKLLFLAEKLFSKTVANS